MHITVIEHITLKSVLIFLCVYRWLAYTYVLKHKAYIGSYIKCMQMAWIDDTYRALVTPTSIKAVYIIQRLVLFNTHTTHTMYIHNTGFAGTIYYICTSRLVLQ